MPFDWRYPGCDSGGLPFLKHLIENASAANGGQRVVLWAVSGGPQWALSFLQRQPQAWKDRYVKFFVAQSPLWSGVAANVPAIVSGVSVPQAGGAYPAPFLKGFSRAVPSVLWLLPRAGANATTTWTRADTIVATPGRNYTAFDLPALFADVGGLDALVPTMQHLRDDPDLGELAAPGVNTFVAYGYGLDTVVGAAYASDLRPGVAPGAPTLVFGSGDNTVPLRSVPGACVRACLGAWVCLCVPGHGCGCGCGCACVCTPGGMRVPTRACVFVMGQRGNQAPR